MHFLNIFGGIALIVFGSRFLRKGLDRLFGQNLVRWLQQLTRNPLSAFAAGVVAGIGTPSSTAVSLVAVQMLTAGQLSAERMLAVFLGANVGITAPSQLLAFHIQDYAAVFLAVGVIGFQFLQRNVLRGVGQVLLALGFIFLSMQMIGSATSSIEPTGDLGLFLRLLASHPWIVLVVAALFAFGLQSSTAAIGLGIGLALGGHFSSPAMLAWVLGANIGIALTTLAAGWSSLEGRRLACGNLFVKSLAAVLLMGFLPRLALSPEAPPNALVQQTVHFHTLFNLGVGLVCLPFIPWLARLMNLLIVPPASQGLDSPSTHLDEMALQSPSLALANATREVLSMADEVKLMLHSFWQAQEKHDRFLAAKVHMHDDHVDDTAASVTEYLSRISQEDLSRNDSQWQFTLLSCVNELETMADIIDKNLCDFVRKQAAHGFPMTDEDEVVLAQSYAIVKNRCDMALSLLTTRDERAASAFITGEEGVEEWCRNAQRSHYERLRGGDERALQSSVYFLDMLGSLRRINSHLTTIAYSFGDEGSNDGNPKQAHQPVPTVGSPVSVA